MKKKNKVELPEKRALTVDEIISRYPMTVRILMVQLVEQIEKLEKKKPKVTEEWIEKWADKFDSIAQQGLIIDIGLIKQMLKEAGVRVA